MFSSSRQGAQGTLDAASDGVLASEFNTKNEDECIKKILESGSMQQVEVCFRVVSTSGATQSS
jgi:ribosome maturation protein Sdo1